jgi:type I restriction enzyme, R subunit
VNEARLFTHSSVGWANHLTLSARETSQGFGRFVRSLVGLDRGAVTEALANFCRRTPRQRLRSTSSKW